MKVNKIALFQDTDLDKLENMVNKYIESCGDEEYCDIDIEDIRLTSVLKPGSVMDEIVHTVMIIHRPGDNKKPRND